MNALFLSAVDVDYVTSTTTTTTTSSSSSTITTTTSATTATTEDTVDSMAGEQGLPKAAITGIAVSSGVAGIALVVALIAVVVFCCLLNYKSPPPPPPAFKNEMYVSSGVDKLSNWVWGPVM